MPTVYIKIESYLLLSTRIWRCRVTPTHLTPDEQYLLFVHEWQQLASSALGPKSNTSG